ncbi:MAG: tagaturonate reductase, partial [Acutalibacteraceae bacterium]|nr:tagaturonate reductase [Acutalibacteraceae bacterium]
MKSINEIYNRDSKKPIKIMQFGEGNFLRSFFDYMIDIANEKGVFSGDVAIVKPISFGSLDAFYEQDNLYTVLLRGKENGNIVNDSRVITSVSKAIDAKNDYDEWLALARLDSLRFIISNTTEAGITLDKNDAFEGLPATYPGKLTKWLFERYNHFDGAADKGVIILPVELIEENGKKLKECALSLANIWNLPKGFRLWLEESCVFCSTLVDRIVTGFPKNDAEEIYKSLG